MQRSIQSLAVVLVCVLLAAGLALAGSSGGERLGDGGLAVFALCTIVAFAVNWAAFVPAYLRRTERFYDLTGSLTYLTVVVIALVAGNGSASATLIGVLVAIWAARLGSFLVLRIRKDGSDGRFDEIKQDPARFLMSWTLQALWVVMTVGCALAAMTAADGATIGLLSVVGAAVWALGFGIEAVADSQKRAFRADPANDGDFIRSGLWAWSRHPNYFGEITLWVGIAVAALPSLSGWQHVTLISPVFVTVLLTRVSGIPMLEARGRKRWGDDPEYREHVRRTPVLIPRPPSR